MCGRQSAITNMFEREVAVLMRTMKAARMKGYMTNAQASRVARDWGVGFDAQQNMYPGTGRVSRGFCSVESAVAGDIAAGVPSSG